MRNKLFASALFLTATLAAAQTNRLTGLLQQGLFEEQASRNLPAAISNYEVLAAQFDRDRQLAATAVFRLGECYRAQGRTNEAAAQYQRVLHDFSDQPTLATLSRQNLAGMGAAVSGAVPTGERLANVVARNPEREREWAVVKKLQGMSLAEIRQTAPTLLTDATLINLIYQYNQTELDLVRLRTDYGEEHHEVQKALAVQKALDTKIHERLEGMAKALAMDLGTAGGATTTGAETVTDVEAQEIQRIQQLVQNSPDLINVVGGDGCTPLANAVSNGWFKVAAYLLDHGADVNAEVSSSDVPLFTAIKAGNKAMVQYLLERGADIHFRDKRRFHNGITPLHLAADNGFTSVTEVLLAHHAEVNAQDDSGDTSLVDAIAARHLKIIQMLIAAGADVNRQNYSQSTALERAVRQFPEACPVLLAAGADPNTADSAGRTPLSCAAERGDVDVVKALLAAKADPNVMGNNGRTPLSYAAEKGEVNVVKALLAAKADANYGKADAPLHCAISGQQVEMAELLLQAGANPNLKLHYDRTRTFLPGSPPYMPGLGLPDSQPDRGDCTPIYLAVNGTNLAALQLLLKYKADPNDVQTVASPPLSMVLDKPDMFKALLDAGATGAGPDLLCRAIQDNLPVIVELLLKHGVDPNFPAGDPALHLAALYVDDEKIFALLLDYKANPNARNKDGSTPLDILLKAREDNSWPGRLGSLAAKQMLVDRLIALLHQHGALDNPPDWDHILLCRPSANYFVRIFTDHTNHWNHFTLLEALYCAKDHEALVFPDLAHIIIVRPSADGTTFKRVAVSVINPTNEQGFVDVPLQFGDAVEIPEREHSLAEPRAFWSSLPQENALLTQLQNLAGEARLVVAGGKTVQLPLRAFNCKIGDVLQSGDARAALTSSSDLTRVKVIRREPKTNKTKEWMVDCSGSPGNSSGVSPKPPGYPMPPSGFPSAMVGHVVPFRTPRYYVPPLTPQGLLSSNNDTSDLWLRAGDVIEVPQKP